MQMKTVWFLLLLVLFSLSPSFQGHAEEIAPANWSGAAGLSVPTDGDSGPCAITPSHGRGVENPCSSYRIEGPDAPSNGSKYEVIGGVGEFTWTVTGATIEKIGPRTAKITVDGACGSGTITVSGSCGPATKDVRFPVGNWVLVESKGIPGSGAANPSNNLCLSPFVTDSFVYQSSRWWYYSGRNKWTVNFYGCTMNSKQCSESWGADGNCAELHQPGVPNFPSELILYSTCEGPPCYNYKSLWSIPYWERYEWQCQ